MEGFKMGKWMFNYPKGFENWFLKMEDCKVCGIPKAVDLMYEGVCESCLLCEQKVSDDLRIRLEEAFMHEDREARISEMIEELKYKHAACSEDTWVWDEWD